MRMMAPTTAIQRAKVTQHAALAALLVMGGLAIAGPSGLLAWSENLRLLDQREAQLATLDVARNHLRRLPPPAKGAELTRLYASFNQLAAVVEG